MLGRDRVDPRFATHGQQVEMSAGQETREGGQKDPAPV